LLTQAGIPYETEIASGDPAHTIVDILERYGCEMVVMGASGMSPLRGALLGSVSNEVLHSANVPVMIVKLTDAVGDDTAIEG
jgi:nucleotide-binding universal stress UspA family protein